MHGCVLRKVQIQIANNSLNTYFQKETEWDSEHFLSLF